ncbi:MAG: deoxyribose-phosphate aldolase [Chloroflexota bacterium]
MTHTITPHTILENITENIAEIRSAIRTSLGEVAIGEPIVDDRQFDITGLTSAQLASLIDHTLLKPDATAEQIEQLCREAVEHGFASVCINPTWLTTCHTILGNASVKRCVVIGFPLGATTATTKAFQTEEAVEAGANEVDMVLNIGRLKSADLQGVFEDIRVVSQVAHAGNALVKVILETSLLTDEEKVIASVIAQDAGADFVKTSTGFGGGGATQEDVALMRQVVGSNLGVKASGGVRTAEDALMVINAGATRIGASAGVNIVKSFAGHARVSGVGEGY